MRAVAAGLVAFLAAAMAMTLALKLSVVLASPAVALPVLEKADADELVALLAEATEEQDVCYGWRIQVDDEAGVSSGVDQGSSLGLDRGLDSCARYVQLVGEIRYTSETSESEDSATWYLRSNIPTGPRTPDLERAGYSADALVGARDDVALFNATRALPLLTAEAGAAPPIVAEPDAQPVVPGDMPTGRSGSDWLRQNGGVLAAGGVVVVAGLGWAGYGFVNAHVQGSKRSARDAAARQGEGDEGDEESTEDQ
jgi:hypothetical protein